MSYTALVTKIYTRPAPGLDNLVIGECGNYQVLVGKDTVDGSLGLFFEADGQLSEEFAKANDLLEYKDADGNRQGGYFEENRRVKSKKFKGIKSEGFWIPLSSLSNLNSEAFHYSLEPTEGTQLDTWGPYPICNKYYTPHTQRQRDNNNQQKQSHTNSMFKKHVDTEPLLKNLHLIPDGSVVTITQKLHGTSHRYGYVLNDVPIVYTWPLSIINRIFLWASER